jgi:hypothetical protein
MSNLQQGQKIPCNTTYSTYLVHNINTVTYQKQKLSKSCSIVSHVELSETKERVLLGPPPIGAFLDPVTCHCEIGVSIVSLPCIACQANFPGNGRALSGELDIYQIRKKNQYLR